MLEVNRKVKLQQLNPFWSWPKLNLLASLITDYCLRNFLLADIKVKP